jgi:flagellin
MSMRINTNVEAFNAQRNLATTSAAFAKSVEKLSSGMRINRAGDDAAGLSISEKMRAQIKGLGQAQRNAQDGISMIQTAEGALGEVHSMLQRMRELAVQASNDTLNSDDRTAVKNELDELGQEIDGIKDRTKFNGKSLLNGNLATTLAGATGTDAIVGDTLATGAVATVSGIDVSGAEAGTTYTFSSTSASQITLTRNSGTSSAASQTISVAAFSGAGDTQDLNFDELGIKMTLTGAGAKTAADTVFDLTAAANDTIVTAASNATANFQIGSEASDTMSVAFSEVSLSSLGLDTGSAGALDAFVASGGQTVTNAQALITAVDDAIQTVSDTRAGLGAKQNRLEHTIANLGVAQENMTASESRVRDVDMASEMVSFTKTQILQQAGTAILAQANSAPNGVLSLLRG